MISIQRRQLACRPQVCSNGSAATHAHKGRKGNEFLTRLPLELILFEGQIRVYPRCTGHS
jgi:hypothetical protein